MSTILLHMVCPSCEFRMQVWNVLHAAHWKCRMQKNCQQFAVCTPSDNIVELYLPTKACIDNKKNLLNSNISSTYPHSMVNFGPLVAEIDWQVWGTPANFNGFCILASLLQWHRLVKVNQTARCLAVSWAGTLYIQFQGLLPPDRVLPGAKFTLRPSLEFSYIGSVTTWHSSSGRRSNFAAWYIESNYRTFTDGATYIRLSDHHVGHRPTFLVLVCSWPVQPLMTEQNFSYSLMPSHFYFLLCFLWLIPFISITVVQHLIQLMCFWLYVCSNCLSLPFLLTAQTGWR